MQPSVRSGCGSTLDGMSFVKIFLSWSSGGWVKIKPKLPHLHASDTSIFTHDVLHSNLERRVQRDSSLSPRLLGRGFVHVSCQDVRRHVRQKTTVTGQGCSVGRVLHAKIW